MANKYRTRFHVRKRIFLNRDTAMRAFAVGIVEDTRQYSNEDENSWKSGWIELVLSDCYRHVSYDFDLRSKESRADALYKIRRIAEIVNRVKEAIETEAESIAQREKKQNVIKPKVKAANG